VAKINSAGFEEGRNAAQGRPSRAFAGESVKVVWAARAPTSCSAAIPVTVGWPWLLGWTSACRHQPHDWRPAASGDCEWVGGRNGSLT